MDAPRATWLGGIAVFAIGFVYGAYWMSTREGLGALGGPVIMMIGAGIAVLVMAAATAWSVARHDVLPPAMLVGTALLALAAGAIAASILFDSGATRDGVDLPVLLFVVALVGLAVTGWAWMRRRPRGLSG